MATFIPAIIIVYYAEAAENKTHPYYTCIHDKTVQAIVASRFSALTLLVGSFDL